MILSLSLGVALAQADLRPRLLALLPENTVTAEVLRWEPDPEYIAVRERIRQATQLDSGWFTIYAAQHRDEPFLPWHEKFGVSENEYSRFIDSSGSGDWLRLVKSGRTARLQVSRSGNKVTFLGGPGAEPLRGLILDVGTGELRVPEGLSAKARPVSVTAKEDNAGLGARKGWGWTIAGNKSPDGNGKGRTTLIANLTLMQLNSGPVLLAYNRAGLVDSKRLPDVDLTLLYDKKQELSKR